MRTSLLGDIWQTSNVETINVFAEGLVATFLESLLESFHAINMFCNRPATIDLGNGTF